MSSLLLCIWNMPEELRLYQINNLPDEEIKVLRKAHNNFITLGRYPENEERAISSVLAADDSTKSNWEGANIIKGWLEKDWHKHRLNIDTPPALLRSRLVITGCAL